MKKNFKLVLALVLSVMMIVGSFAAIAAEDRTVDTTISITGLETGDTVNLYQIVKWVDGDGWKLTSNFDTDAIKALSSIQKIINPQPNQGVIQLTKAEVETIAARAKQVTADAETVTTSNSYSKDIAYADAGMYLALIAPVTAGVIYNPIVVSADFDLNGTDTISSSALLGTSETIAVAKRQDDTVIKTEPKITNDIGDEYEFTIKTTIPTYSASFTNTYFNVSDTMSDYLKGVGNSLTITDDSDADVTPTTNTFADGCQSFQITFNDAFIKALTAPLPITITYKAKLTVSAAEAAELENVHQEYNYVTVEFPNNPNDDTGKTVLKDGTREYTFTIDGDIFGKEEWETTELIKVGLDRDGKPIESVVKYETGSSHAALDGAVFKLYTTKEAAEADTDGTATSGVYSNSQFSGTITTNNDGRFFIPGLDAGTYWLKEISAPKGYIKDQKVHKITITAVLSNGYANDDGTVGEKITEWYKIENGNVVWYDYAVTGGTKYEYWVPVLESYSVTIDDANTTTYTVTLSADSPAISSVSITASDTEIVNMKGVELPHTGGVGTTIFYIGGSLLVLAAAILLITKRRMSSND